MTLGTNVPTPAFTNVPIAPQFYLPSYFQIANITPGATTQITILPNFGRTGNFVVGQKVRFIIPNRYGMYQLNNQTGIVTEIVDDLNFKVDINTQSGYNAFVPTPTNERQIAQVIPQGTYQTGYPVPDPADVSLNNLTIPGSFTNTQPYVGN